MSFNKNILKNHKNKICLFSFFISILVLPALANYVGTNDQAITIDVIKNYLYTHLMDIISIVSGIVTILLAVPWFEKHLFPTYEPLKNTYNERSCLPNLPQTPVNGIEGFMILCNVRKNQKKRFFRTLSWLSAVWFLIIGIYFYFFDINLYSTFIFITFFLIFSSYNFNFGANQNLFYFTGFILFGFLVFITISSFLENYISLEMGYYKIFSNIIILLMLILFIGLATKICLISVKRYWNHEINYTKVLEKASSVGYLILFTILIIKNKYLDYLMPLFLMLAGVVFGVSKSINKPFDNKQNKLYYFIDLIIWFLISPIILIPIITHILHIEDETRKLMAEVINETKKYGGAIPISKISENLKISIDETLRICNYILEQNPSIMLNKIKIDFIAMNNYHTNDRFDFVLYNRDFSNDNYVHYINRDITNEELNILNKISENDEKFAKKISSDMYDSIRGSKNLIDSQEYWKYIKSLYGKGLILPKFAETTIDKISLNNTIIFDETIKISKNVLKYIKHKNVINLNIYDVHGMIIKKINNSNVVSLTAEDEEICDRFSVKMSKSITLNENKTYLKKCVLLVFPGSSTGYIVKYGEICDMCKLNFLELPDFLYLFIKHSIYDKSASIKAS